jgi:indolepyruvate ferredoxin oxidoreductase alpha subunit
MAERSFKKEVEKLRLGEGDEFRGEGILAITKALLQAGVSYVGGYQGSPISHLIDVFCDAEDYLEELNVRFDASASEASAAAMLAASINYPMRGAVAWKSPVGTNVASDALANVASAGVKGGALIILGEDYGEGSSVTQERSHAFAMKSQMWLLDPRSNHTTMVDMVEHGFALSEASNTPVFLQMRIRTCHMHGAFMAKDNVVPKFTAKDALDNPVKIANRMVGPPYHFLHEVEKIEERWPNAQKYIRDNKLNEIFYGSESGVGIIVLGGIYNNLIKALQRLGLSDSYGDSSISLYVLNVAYPLIEEELIDFVAGKDAVILLEEGNPDYLEQGINSILRKRDIPTKLSGKDLLPMMGGYTVRIIEGALGHFLQKWTPQLQLTGSASAVDMPQIQEVDKAALAKNVVPRLPGLCTGCPERPFFTAMKLLEREIGPLQVSMDIGCHSFAGLGPFNIGNTQTGYGLGVASASALMVPHERPAFSIIGDGGFWHNALTTGLVNSVENQHNGVVVVVDNNYTAATGGQWTLSSDAVDKKRQYRIPIADAAKAVGVKWVRNTDNYKIAETLKVLREAVSTKVPGPKVIVAEGECQLNRQRRIKPQIRQLKKEGKRYVRERFGIDPDVCTGDHSCIRLSGCPSLTIKENPDAILRKDPVAHVDNSCVGCGVCGEVSHAAVLCPSFFRADAIFNPGFLDKMLHRLRSGFISWLQEIRDTRAEKYRF